MKLRITEEKAPKKKKSHIHCLPRGLCSQQTLQTLSRRNDIWKHCYSW